MHEGDGRTNSISYFHRANSRTYAYTNCSTYTRG